MKSLYRLLPVFIAFYCMGFVDIVGTAVNLAAADFNLNATHTQFLTSMIFLWFLIFSLPTGILQERIGKKNVVLIALAVTILAMLIPFFFYSYSIMLLGFALLGIGNTIIQVSLNPLLYDVSPEGSYSSNMSLSQFIKSVAAFFGPLLTVLFVDELGDWKFIFLAYGGLSLITIVWLMFTSITEKARKSKPAKITDCISLLGNRFVLLMVLGIFIVVGLDVGMNTGVPRFLEQFGLSPDKAVESISVFYIFSLMASRFLGAVVLKKISPRIFFIISAFLTIAGLILLTLGINSILTKLAIVIIGLGSANIFPLIFSISVEKMPERSNEISGLMIMAISGGAIFPLIMGVIIDHIGLTASILFLLTVTLYLGFLSVKNLNHI